MMRVLLIIETPRRLKWVYYTYAITTSWVVGAEECSLYENIFKFRGDIRYYGLNFIWSIPGSIWLWTLSESWYIFIYFIVGWVILFLIYIFKV
jgi:hypothetical protein